MSRGIGFVRVSTTTGPTGSPQLRIGLPGAEGCEDCNGAGVDAKLDRDDVEQLREACDDFLAGRSV